MSETVSLMLSLVAGGLLGAMFFGGLWWTTQKVVSSRHPAILCFGSLLLRMSAAMAGFYFIAGGSWKRMMGCLLGFFMARLMVTYLTRGSNKQADTEQEGSHAPQS